jgi:hypothetical protein
MRDGKLVQCCELLPGLAIVIPPRRNPDASLYAPFFAKENLEYWGRGTQATKGPHGKDVLALRGSGYPLNATQGGRLAGMFLGLEPVRRREVNDGGQCFGNPEKTELSDGRGRPEAVVPRGLDPWWR